MLLLFTAIYPLKAPFIRNKVLSVTIHWQSTNTGLKLES